MSSNHMGVAITPATLADGSLFTALDPKLHPSRAVGDGAVVTASDPEGALGIPVVSTGTATTGGTLAAGTYRYRVSAVSAEGEGPLSAEVSRVTTGTTSTVTLTWPAVDGETAGYKVYGRTIGAELHMADIPHGTLTYTDTGATTPAGALPTKVDQDVLAGELEGNQAPRPVDGGTQPVEGEGDGANDTTQTEAADGQDG